MAVPTFCEIAIAETRVRVGKELRIEAWECGVVALDTPRPTSASDMAIASGTLWMLMA